jgi:hypothetical protein
MLSSLRRLHKFVCVDHLKSIKVITAANGTEAQRTTYQAFGNRVNQTTLHAESKGFTLHAESKGFTHHRCCE